jgi:hypothetical protein
MNLSYSKQKGVAKLRHCLYGVSDYDEAILKEEAALGAAKVWRYLRLNTVEVVFRHVEGGKV